MLNVRIQSVALTRSLLAQSGEEEKSIDQTPSMQMNPVITKNWQVVVGCLRVLLESVNSKRKLLRWRHFYRDLKLKGRRIKPDMKLKGRKMKPDMKLKGRNLRPN